MGVVCTLSAAQIHRQVCPILQMSMLKISKAGVQQWPKPSADYLDQRWLRYWKSSVNKSSLWYYEYPWQQQLVNQRALRNRILRSLLNRMQGKLFQGTFEDFNFRCNWILNKSISELNFITSSHLIFNHHPVQSGLASALLEVVRK